MSGASTTSSVVGSKEKVNIGDEGGDKEDGISSRLSSQPLSQEHEQDAVSSLSSFALSEGEPPSKSTSPPDEVSLLGPSDPPGYCGVSPSSLLLNSRKWFAVLLM